VKTLVAGLIGLTVLVGCASNSAEQPAAAPAAAAEPAAPAAAAKNASANPTPAAVARRDATPAVAAPKTVAAPAGTELEIVLVDSLSSDTNKAGDQFTGTLAAPLVIGGQTVLDRGTKVQGRVVDAEGAGRVKGRASMRLVLTNITAAGKAIPIVTQTMVSEAEATKGRDATVVGGGAGIGAAIGAIAGGKSGAAKGALIGTAAGAGTVLATKGKEVEFASESRLKFKLEKSVEIPRS